MSNLKSATRRSARKSAKSASGQQELKPATQAAPTAPAIDANQIAALLGWSPDQLQQVREMVANGGINQAQAASAAPQVPDNSPVVRVENYTNKRGNSFPSIQIWYEGVKLTRDGREYKADFFIGGSQFRKLLAILDDQADSILDQLDKLESGKNSKSSK